MFDTLTIRDARPIIWMKRVFVFVITVFLAIGMVSSYRAYVQVRSLELNAPRLLSPGVVINTSVVSSGRTMVDVEVDLIQGAHSERLLRLHLPGNELAFFDPRTQQGSETLTLTQEMLSRFQPGVARLRSVATGRHQWMRLPPPTVREIEVEVKSAGDPIESRAPNRYTNGFAQKVRGPTELLIFVQSRQASYLDRVSTARGSGGSVMRMRYCY